MGSLKQAEAVKGRIKSAISFQWNELEKVPRRVGGEV